MFYIEKVISSILTPPGLILLIFFIVSMTLLLKSRERGPKTLAIILLLLTTFGYLLSTGIGTYLYLQPLENAYSVPKSIEGQAIVVLSAGTITTPNGETLGNHTVARLSQALYLHLQTKLPIIVTGSSAPKSSAPPIAELMRDWLLERGVLTSRIVVEPQARTTWENAKYVARLCDQFGWTQVVLVTSAVHMRRAVKSFKKFDLKVTPFPTDYLYDHAKLSTIDFLPTDIALTANLAAVHELFGQISYTFKSP